MNGGHSNAALVTALGLALFAACGGNSRDGGTGPALGGAAGAGKGGNAGAAGASGRSNGATGEEGDGGEPAGGSGAADSGGSAGTTTGGVAGMPSGGSGGTLDSCGCAEGDLQCNIRCAANGGAGDCETDKNCNGGLCIELAPGGYRVCASGPIEATSCGSPDPQPFPNECCDSSECGKGICVAGPGPEYCGGPAIEPYNYCASDGCQTSADCDAVPNGVCWPAGAYGFPVATCRTGGCRVDADCTEGADGRCLLHPSQCCGVPSLACVYADGCVSGADCPDDSPHCLVQDGRTVCSPELEVCPA
jgi:hypothetical protein